jgi:SAM-dependent methyltransferase
MTEYIGKSNLEIMEAIAPRYNRFLAKKLTSFFYPQSTIAHEAILDFGAGIGTLAVEIMALGITEVDCLEIDQSMRQIINEKGIRTFSNLETLPKKYSYVYMSNVLEHVEDDVYLLREIASRAMVPGGTLVIFVPAFSILFSKMDEQVGHFRRYHKNSLNRVVKGAGLDVQHQEYVDSLGFLSLLALKAIFGSRLELSSNSQLVRIYDKVIFPISRVLDQLGLRLLFGKNLLLVARKRI